jgi:hypothetical protein
MSTITSGANGNNINFILDSASISTALSMTLTWLGVETDLPYGHDLESAILNVDISKSVLMGKFDPSNNSSSSYGIFQFSIDSHDIDDTLENDIKYKVASNDWSNNVLNGDSFLNFSNGDIEFSTVLDISNTKAYMDILRHISVQSFGVPHGVDLFSNEAQIKQSIVNLDNTINNSFYEFLRDASGGVNGSASVIEQTTSGQSTFKVGDFSNNAIHSTVSTFIPGLGWYDVPQYGVVYENSNYTGRTFIWNGDKVNNSNEDTILAQIMTTIENTSDPNNSNYSELVDTNANMIEDRGDTNGSNKKIWIKDPSSLEIFLDTSDDAGTSLNNWNNLSSNFSDDGPFMVEIGSGSRTPAEELLDQLRGVFKSNESDITDANTYPVGIQRLRDYLGTLNQTNDLGKDKFVSIPFEVGDTISIKLTYSFAKGFDIFNPNEDTPDLRYLVKLNVV